jgi:hypothetical protein
LEETLLKKGFFQAIFPKLLKVFGKGFKGKTLFQKGFPLKLMTLPLERGNKKCSIVKVKFNRFIFNILSTITLFDNVMNLVYIISRLIILHTFLLKVILPPPPLR